MLYVVVTNWQQNQAMNSISRADLTHPPMAIEALTHSVHELEDEVEPLGPWHEVVFENGETS